MHNWATQIVDKPQITEKQSSGHLLINKQDEIIYANKQARYFLGLLKDEALPVGQKFMPLVQSVYQCYPTMAWFDWPKRPSPNTARYLIFSAKEHASFSLLKVEIVETIIIDNQEIWAVAIDLVESSLGTAVTYTATC